MPHPTKVEDVDREEQQPDGYHQFVQIHGPQLLNCGVPDFYWPTLFQKLSKEVMSIANLRQRVLKPVMQIIGDLSIEHLFFCPLHDQIIV